MATKEEIIARKSIATERYILSTLPVLYLPLHRLDGDSFVSSDGHGHIVTATTAPWRFMGREFDGASGMLTVPDATSIRNIFDGGGTIECWINANSDGEGDLGSIVDKAEWSFYLADEAPGKVKVALWCDFDGVANGTWITTSTEVTLNNWVHITLTYNSSATANDAIIYINGTAVAMTESSTPVGTRTTDVGPNLIIGNASTDNFTFDGTIGEVRLYTRILSVPEIQNNYLATCWRYR